MVWECCGLMLIASKFCWTVLSIPCLPEIIYDEMRKVGAEQGEHCRMRASIADELPLASS